MSSAAARERWRDKRTAMIERFCSANGFKLEALNHGYQLRIEDSFDFYPTNGRWHFLPTGERGDWHTELDLKLVILEMLKPELDIKREAEIVMIPADDVYRLSHPTTFEKPGLWHKLTGWLRRNRGGN